ncbi:4-hydroxythreonine-4-phosphate dehydrogenase [Ktedonobacteria bacterium brp13]|nr:4-hydroxythreonine-4-phosphate dehydrogenase [Ktedonobacteria bacterium brp13]
MEIQKTPVVAVTMGDPTGIGPEVIAKGLKEHMVGPEHTVIVGDPGVMRRAFDLVGLQLQIVPGTQPTNAADSIAVADIDLAGVTQIPIGKIDRLGGEAAARAIKLSAQLALSGQVDAIVSSPVNKTALNYAGYHYMDSTDFYTELAGKQSHILLIHGGNVNAFMVSTHVSLQHALELITVDRVLTTIEAAHATLTRLGSTHPRIGVVGVNPHMGENGILGREEIEILKPAMEAARARGIEVTELVPAESLVSWTQQGRVDGVVSMFHDQATTAMKPLGYSTFAIGLPFIRCAVGHGTAHDIAGTGAADPRIFVQTYQLASLLTKNGYLVGAHEHA